MFKSYKKRLGELKAAETLDMATMVEFVIGKGSLRLPTRNEVIESFQAMDADSMVGGVKNIDYGNSDKKGWAAEKLLMDNMIVRITSTPMTKELAVDQLLKLWTLAHNKRKRQYLIAAITIVAVAGGIALAKFFMDDKSDSDDEILGEMDMDEIDYDQDIPEVEIGSIPDLA